MNTLHSGLTAGYEYLSAWSDLLDRINVFPVADSDTGTNLRISLAPFRHPDADPGKIRALLARCATGNSGNISVAFFRELCKAEDCADLVRWVREGRAKAYKAVAAPQPGTMLSFFDALKDALQSWPADAESYHEVMSALERAVHDTTKTLPDLDRAGVVDSGALGMYIFFEGFLHHLIKGNNPGPSVIERFGGKLAINESYIPAPSTDYCIDAVIHTELEREKAEETIAALGESIVMLPEESGYKIHVHSSRPEQLRNGLQSIGELVRWSDEKIEGATGVKQSVAQRSTIHLVTDAAGSITRELADQLGITLLDSYIVTDDEARPESLCSPEKIYTLLKNGIKVTTAQASTYERHQHYQSICQQFGLSLYLCVGSAFTGNYAVASNWQKNNDSQGQFMVIDSGAASGRLGLMAMLTAQQAREGVEASEVCAFARKMMAACVEYVFIDELKYLVAGGRVSKAQGFFGDLMRMKPIVSPMAQGVRKVGVVRSREAQLRFAQEQLVRKLSKNAEPVILLQYSDNEQWVRDIVKYRLQRLLPGADIILAPLSLTSGVHMGPGTWSMAFVPERYSDKPPRYV